MQRNDIFPQHLDHVVLQLVDGTPLKKKNRKWTDADTVEFRKLVQQGFDWADIGRLCGHKSAGWAKMKATRLGIKSKRR